MLNLRIQNPFHSTPCFKRYAHISRLASESNPVRKVAGFGTMMGIALASVGLYTPFQKLKQSICKLNSPDDTHSLTEVLRDYLLPEPNLRESLSSQLNMKLLPKPPASIPLFRSLNTLIGTNCDMSEFAVKANNAQKVFFNLIRDPQSRLTFLRMIYKIYKEDFFKVVNSRLRDNDMNELTSLEFTEIMSINGYLLNPKLTPVIVNINIAELEDSSTDPIFIRSGHGFK